jgi:hypothetical protein
MSKPNNTPGYNIHLEVWFATMRNGRKVAYYWSYGAFRAIRMSLADAELFVSTGQATEIPGHPFKPPPAG